jgi:hypothetical protein
MSSFVLTPTNVDYLESLFYDPITGQWFVPTLVYNTAYISPFFKESDPLNEDPRYQDKVIDHFWIKLTEKWLYKDPIFTSLLKYFHVTKEGETGKITLNNVNEKTDIEKLTESDKMHILKYIEKFFITRRFVEKVLREYVNSTHIKWYDLFNNSSTIKDLLKHKLKNLIESTRYELLNHGK